MHDMSFRAANRNFAGSVYGTCLYCCHHFKRKHVIVILRSEILFAEEVLGPECCGREFESSARLAVMIVAVSHI
jgi:hypothetical protein